MSAPQHLQIILDSSVANYRGTTLETRRVVQTFTNRYQAGIRYLELSSLIQCTAHRLLVAVLLSCAGVRVGLLDAIQMTSKRRAMTMYRLNERQNAE